jgi:hypothetical protein
VNERLYLLPANPTTAFFQIRLNQHKIGNGWVTFSCDIEGRKRKFMLHQYSTYGNYTVGTITELTE